VLVACEEAYYTVTEVLDYEGAVSLLDAGDEELLVGMPGDFEWPEDDASLAQEIDASFELDACEPIPCPGRRER
jgi:hypothetical protein